jgi:hypothetical protein
VDNSKPLWVRITLFGCSRRGYAVFGVWLFSVFFASWIGAGLVGVSMAGAVLVYRPGLALYGLCALGALSIGCTLNAIRWMDRHGAWPE